MKQLTQIEIDVAHNQYAGQVSDFYIEREYNAYKEGLNDGIKRSD